MTRKITTDTIEGLLTARDIRDLDYESVLSCVLDDETISPWRPEGVCRVDPRNGERTVYSPVRAARASGVRIPCDASSERRSSRVRL